MELESVVKFLENKTFLVTGATGFLAKILVEKILRTQPNAKKLYLIVRATDCESANQRFQNEAIGKELFKVLKRKMGDGFNSFVEEKVRMVPGDITCEDLGIKDANLKSQMFKELDVIINSAATTDFHERYDVSLFLNTYGAMNVLDFAKKCINLKVFVHVSTAFVSGEQGGVILETSYMHNGKTSLNGTHGLEVEEEKMVVEKKLIELQKQGTNSDAVKLAMKDLGLQRARKYGWPNVYVFTKALGEMLIMEHKQHLPVVIIRPTIITSTYKEPFPGWIEGIRTIDSLALGYGKGRLPFFVCDVDTVIDLIPGDMVVNATLVAMAAQTSQLDETTIYQIGSSLRNPFKIGDFSMAVYCYFTKNPLIDKKGKPIVVDECKFLDSMDRFNKYMAINYLLPLKGFELVNVASCQYFARTCKELKAKVEWVLRMVDLYRPYLFFNGVFDDMNVEKLRLAARHGNVESDIFYFDPQDINWEDYFINIHFPGLVKYVIK